MDVQGGWEEHDLSAQSQRRLEVYDLKLNADATWQYYGTIGTTMHQSPHTSP